MIKKDNVYKALWGAGITSPPLPSIDDLVDLIIRENPSARFGVLYIYGKRWMIVPVGHECKIKTLYQASETTVYGKLLPVSYFEIERKG